MYYLFIVLCTKYLQLIDSKKYEFKLKRKSVAREITEY